MGGLKLPTGLAKQLQLLANKRIKNTELRPLNYSNECMINPSPMVGTNSTYSVLRPTITASAGRLSLRCLASLFHSSRSIPDGLGWSSGVYATLQHNG